MPTSYVDLYANQGADTVFLISLADDNSVTIDLTGYTVRAKFAKHHSSSTKYEFLAEVAPPSTAGVVTLRLFSVDTDNIKPGRYQYDVETVYDNNGQVTVERVAEGVLYLEPSITK
jgi:hypothetical protein